jgi:hypothetical protein
MSTNVYLFLSFLHVAAIQTWTTPFKLSLIILQLYAPSYENYRLQCTVGREEHHIGSVCFSLCG